MPKNRKNQKTKKPKNQKQEQQQRRHWRLARKKHRGVLKTNTENLKPKTKNQKTKPSQVCVAGLVVVVAFS
jgi:hypothetical protein